MPSPSAAPPAGSDDDWPEVSNPTHHDSLVARLNEPRVRRVIQPHLAEHCDGIDNDCDGEIDELPPGTLRCPDE